MLNKKIIAVAIAAACSTNAFAAVDLNSSDSQLLTYSLESANITDDVSAITNYGTVAELNDAGIGAAGTLDVATRAGVSTPASNSVFIRYDLTNALFSALTNDTNFVVANPGGAGTAVTARAGGGANSSFLVLEVAVTGATLPSDAIFTLNAPGYNALVNETASIQYSMYSTLSEALNPSASLSLTSQSADFINVTNVSTGDYAVAETATSTIASQFTRFLDNGNEVTSASVGSINTDRLLPSGTTPLNTDSTQANDDDLLSGSYSLTLTGDLSLGGAFLATGANASCTAGAGVGNTLTNFSDAGVIAALTAADLTATGHKVCLNAEDDAVIARDSYSLTLAQGNVALADDIGSVVYNTTAYELPYLTTFDKYNQRLYITNNSSVDGAYTISFTGEEDATVTAKAAATGTVPANSMIVLKATDLVTIEGRTRTSAVVELEISDSDAQVSVQSVNIATDGTDTVVLSAQ